MAKSKDYQSKYPDPVLANNLKRLLAEKNLLQKDVARVCDKERKAVCNWINQYSSPSAYDLKMICLEYRVSADELLGLNRTKERDEKHE